MATLSSSTISSAPLRAEPTSRRHPYASLHARIAATLLVFPCIAGAAQAPGQAADMGPEPPSLPGEERANPKGAFNVDAGNITIRDRAVHNTLGVRLDGYAAVRPSIAFENGWLLRSDLGVGGAYKLRNNYSDLLLNAVYAPRRDVRIQMSVSQLRSAEGFVAPHSGELITVLQTAYLASVRKLWEKSRLLPEAGMAMYAARAADSSRQDLTTHRLEMGTMGGYMLNVAARPAYHSRIELAYKSQSVAYDHPLADQLRQQQSLRSVDYSRVFDDCSRVNGRYSSGSGANQINLQFERRGFTVGVLQTRTAQNKDNMIRVGYSQPLGGAAQRQPSCSGKPIAPTGLQALVDATTSRSAFLPNQPVARLAALKAADMH